ncbi:MAG: aminoacyl-tRNA hydrolase [Patescibacteria group bacterium]|nr:aminoacyl-tRNA hydrolase [Patescibacteria group bacterium]
MALFQNRPQASDTHNYYTVGLNKTVLLVGLGNPGKEYNLTRHNIGFEVLDRFVAKQTEMQDWVNKKDLKCHISQGQFGDTRVYVIKPTTFMNLSGEAVQAVVNFYKIAPDFITVIHDELDVNFGQIRLRVGGGSAGHNGIKSVTQHIGEQYGRIRIGIGPKTPEQMDSADFVLQKFATNEQAQLDNLAKETGAILTEFIYSGQALPTETRTFLI